MDFNFIKQLTEKEEFINYDLKYQKKFEKNDLTVISFDYLFTLAPIFNKIKAIDLFLNSHKELIDKCNFIMSIKGFEKQNEEDFE